MQEVGLALRFHAFGDQTPPKAAAELDDGAHDRTAGARDAAAVDLVDEGAVDLERVDRELLQATEGGVAGPEIVDREVDAQAE